MTLFVLTVITMERLLSLGTNAPVQGTRSNTVRNRYMFHHISYLVLRRPFAAHYPTLLKRISLFNSSGLSRVHAGQASSLPYLLHGFNGCPLNSRPYLNPIVPDHTQMALGTLLLICSLTFVQISPVLGPLLRSSLKMILPNGEVFPSLQSTSAMVRTLVVNQYTRWNSWP